MKTVYDAIQAMAATPKRKEKEQILEDIKSSPINSTFKRVAFLALDPRHNFNIVEYDESEILSESTGEAHMSLDEALDELEDVILNQGVRGNAAKDFLYRLTGKLSPEDRTVLKHIIDRTLKCGVSDKTVNKVWSDFIYVHPYRRCSSFSEKNLENINMPAISQVKEDGMYADIVVADGKVEYRSRSGGYFDWKVDQNEDLLKKHAHDFVLMGEALVRDENGDIMDRQSGNGYLNGDEVDPSRIIFSLWDIIPYSEWKAAKSKQPYEKTFEMLENVVGNLNDNFRVVDTRYVNEVDEIISHFKHNVQSGLEGSIIKNIDSVWKDGTSKDQVKLKIVFEVDLEVVEVYEGEKGKKYEGMAGGIKARTSDGLLITDIGSGFKDKEREQFYKNKSLIEGKIVTVKACDIVKSDDNEHYALLHSRFVEVRNDKFEADSFERVKEQKQASIESLSIIT